MTVRYFYDCEFLEDGKTIELISIGIACEDGREYYAVNADADIGRVRGHLWLMRHVLPHLPIRGRETLERRLKHADNVHPRPSIDNVDLDRTDTCVKPTWVIANEVRDFLLGDLPEGTDIELWADYGAYDHVALAQLWGPMIRLPKGVPMWTNDIQTYARLAGVPHKHLPNAKEDVHHALADAVNVWDRYTYIREAQKVKTR